MDASRLVAAAAALARTRRTAVGVLPRAPWRVPMAAIVVCAAALGASACLSATPPKTPNQREVERHAPRVVVPLPVGERTPRPAPTP